MIEVPPTAELLVLVLQVTTFLGVIPLVMMELIVLEMISELVWGLHRVTCFQESPLLDMEEYLCPGGIQR